MTDRTKPKEPKGSKNKKRKNRGAEFIFLFAKQG